MVSILAGHAGLVVLPCLLIDFPVHFIEFILNPVCNAGEVACEAAGIWDVVLEVEFALLNEGKALRSLFLYSFPFCCIGLVAERLVCVSIA